MGVEAVPDDGDLGHGRRAEEGETRRPKAENRAAGVSTAMEGLVVAPEGVTAEAKGVSWAMKGVTLAAKGVSFAAGGVFAVTAGVSLAANGITAMTRGVSFPLEVVPAEADQTPPMAEKNPAMAPPRASVGRDEGKSVACEIGADTPVALFLRFGSPASNMSSCLTNRTLAGKQ
jgi:hypothetical protein